MKMIFCCVISGMVNLVAKKNWNRKKRISIFKSQFLKTLTLDAFVSISLSHSFSLRTSVYE